MHIALCDIETNPVNNVCKMLTNKGINEWKEVIKDQMRSFRLGGWDNVQTLAVFVCDGAP